MNEKELFKALGPLASLYQDETVREIMVDGPNHVYVERDGKLEDVDISFESVKALQEMVDSVLALTKTQLTPQETIADIRLQGISRFRVVGTPTAINGPFVVIRKPFLGRVLTWEDLLEFKAVNQEIIDLLQSAVDAEVNILVAGGTFSGKTTLLNMLAGLIAPEKRLVAVENIHDLRIEHPRVVYLESKAANAPMNELIEMGSLMVPSWLIVSGLQGSEALKVLQKFNSGHAGMVNMHAESVEDALTRLETMCLMANMNLSLEEIRHLIASSIQLISYIKYLQTGKRKMTNVVELQGYEDGRYLLQPLIRFNFETGEFESPGVKPSWE